ncbi:MAG: peptidoglycan DD-metalloendopeptidase family protein [Terriglobales bacterium]
MNPRFLLLCLVLAVAGPAVLALAFDRVHFAEQQLAREVELSLAEAKRIRAQSVEFAAHTIPSRTTLAEELQSEGLDRATVFAVVEQAGRVFDLRKVRAGQALTLGRTPAGELRSVRYLVDPERELRIERRAGAFHAEIHDIPFTSGIASLGGQVRNSLFNAVTDLGESPELALILADIFGWDLDFYTDPQPGDTFGVVVEKKVSGRDGSVRYGRLLAAEYVNHGRPYRAVLFRDPAGQPAYYAPDGQSMKKAFLRSPLKFAAPVTSHFSYSRFHPILKRRRPHLGVDYGAPAGTPVQAIGEGRVIAAGWSGGGGNTVHLRHSNGFDTFYLHLSRILVRTGQRVAQGQVIGRVGATGLATGPHLDFRVTQHGKFRNFEALRLPPAQPVSKRDFAQFEAERDHWLALLPSAETIVAHAGDQSDNSEN